MKFVGASSLFNQLSASPTIDFFFICGYILYYHSRIFLYIFYAPYFAKMRVHIGLGLSVQCSAVSAVPRMGGGGHSLVSSVPMRDQRIVEHTLNSVIDI